MTNSIDWKMKMLEINERLYAQTHQKNLDPPSCDSTKYGIRRWKRIYLI